MSTTISYKGSTIATVDNETKTLTTAGTWMEDDITLVDSSDSIEDKFITVTFNNNLETGGITLSQTPVTNIIGTSGYVEMNVAAMVTAGSSITKLMPYGFGLAVRTTNINSDITQNFELRINNTVINPLIEGKSSTVYYKYYVIPKSQLDLLDSSNNVIDFYSISDPFKDTVITDTLLVTTNGTYTATSGTAYSEVDVSISPTLQSKTNIDPTTSSQTITPDTGYDGLSSVQINAMPSGSATTPATSITANPSISVNTSTGVITATSSATQSVTPTVSAGYVSSGTAGTVTVSGSNTSALSTQSGTTINPTESEQTAVAANKYTLGAVKVGAISPTYVGSGIAKKNSSDAVVDGPYVDFPAGYYAEQHYGTVSSGTEGTPIATKGAVSNHSISITPSVTNSEGFISGETKTGTAVTVTASELASGNKAIDSNGTNIDVVGYSTVSVDVQPSLQSKTGINPSTSSQTISPDSGYYGLSSVQINAMPTMTLPTSASSSATSGYTSKATISRSTSAQYINIPTGYNSAGAYYTISATPNGTVTAPASISGTSATVSTGTNTLTLTKTVSVTPNVTTAGYISSGTAGNSSVSLTASINIRSSSDLTVSGDTVTAPAGYYSAAASKAVSSMTLPTSASASATSGYTSKATISRSTSDQYINIPVGYNASGAYYKINAVANGTEGTPIATKGTVSNYSISITPSVTNTAGYISGGTKTGTAVTVSASELVSGTYTVDSSGTKDITNYASVTIPAMTLPNNTSSSRVGTQIASILPQTYRSFLNIPAGYNDTAQSYYIGGAELTSLTITENGVYNASDPYDVYGFSTVTVNVPTSSEEGTNYRKTTIVPQATITPNSSTRHANVAGTSDGFIDAAYYIVTYDGVEWLTTCETLWTENYCIGDVGWFFSAVPSDYIYPFGVIYEDGTYTVAAKDTNQHIVKIERLEFTSDGDSIKVGNLEGVPSTTSSISFTGLEGEPTSFYFMVDTSVATGTPGKVAAVVFDGTTLHAQTITNTSNAQVTYDTSSLSKTYSNGTLTITSSNLSFVSDYYYGSYTYDGNDIYTKDVQVGSGATSITFTELEDEPVYWSCIFKSNFGTSSGYQRVVYVAKTSTGISGIEMDSGSHNAVHWTASYNNGSLTITSQGTNTGGYFHQPGYYQLTYAIEDNSSGGGSSELNLQAKTNISPTTSSQTITADSGYDGLSSVQINAMPTMTLPSSASSTSSGTSKATISRSTSNQYINIPTGYNSTAQYYTISATPNMTLPTAASSTSSGTSKATITPETTAQYLNIPTGYNETAQYYTISAVTYSTIRTGTTTPASSLGSNGDVYIKTS